MSLVYEWGSFLGFIGYLRESFWRGVDPNGGSNYVVYVFSKNLGERGRVFSTDDAFFEWLEGQPKQLSLPFGEISPQGHQ